MRCNTNICSVRPHRQDRAPMAVAYPVFRAALDRGDLQRVLALARQMPAIKLSDALEMVLLMRTGDEPRFDRACVRWLGRFALEVRDVSLEELRVAADALDNLPDRPDEAMAQLQRLCVERGIA